MGSDNTLPGNVVEILRSVVAFAKEPNLSRVADTLHISRPTLRKHLKQFEEVVGSPFLQRIDHTTYQITDFGNRLLSDVESWLGEGEALLNAKLKGTGSLFRASLDLDDDWFEIQQHPLNSLWDHKTPLLSEGFKCWLEARGWIESDAFKPIRDQIVITRTMADDWVIVEIGEKSSMTFWLGWEHVKSALGKTLSSSPITTEADELLLHAFRKANLTGTPWYDHVSTTLPKSATGERIPVNYRRLVLPCRFPDASPAIASLVERTDELVIGDFEVPRVNQQTGGASHQ